MRHQLNTQLQAGSLVVVTRKELLARNALYKKKEKEKSETQI